MRTMILLIGILALATGLLWIGQGTGYVACAARRDADRLWPHNYVRPQTATIRTMSLRATSMSDR